MKIGELFIDLGVKGKDVTGKAIRSIHDGLQGVADTSLSTKAAIVGVVFGIERMMSFSSKMGAGLKEFSLLTGLSTRELQKWQYAGRKVNVSNEEVESSFKSIQQAMGDMLIGKGAPEGMALLADAVGFDENKAKDTLFLPRYVFS